MADDDIDQPRLSTSERRRQLALDHVRAARARIESAPRPKPTFEPGRDVAPPPHLPTDPPEQSDDLQIGAVAGPGTESAVAPTGEAEDDDAEVERLLAAVEALTAKYEMEMAAHRHTTEQLIAQQQAHIDSLQRLVQELSRRVATDSID